MQYIDYGTLFNCKVIISKYKIIFITSFYLAEDDFLCKCKSAKLVTLIITVQKFQ